MQCCGNVFAAFEISSFFFPVTLSMFYVEFSLIYLLFTPVINRSLF